jgi:hypothetical protein
MTITQPLSTADQLVVGGYSAPVTDITRHDWAVNTAEYGNIPYSLRSSKQTRNERFLLESIGFWLVENGYTSFEDEYSIAGKEKAGEVRPITSSLFCGNRKVVAFFIPADHRSSGKRFTPALVVDEGGVFHLVYSS